MKKYAFAIVIALVVLLVTGVIAADENDVFLPLVYEGHSLAPPDGTPIFTETPTSTPTETPTSTPTETPTPTPEGGEDYNWVFVGRAGNLDDTLTIYGVSPGYCYDILYSKVEKTIYLEAAKIPVDECDRDGYNPDADWPPPEFPPPPSLPPEFAYGDVFKLVLDVNAKFVCSVYWPSNCVNVR
jgi:hypothetical protein